MQQPPGYPPGGGGGYGPPGGGGYGPPGGGGGYGPPPGGGGGGSYGPPPGGGGGYGPPPGGGGGYGPPPGGGGGGGYGPPPGGGGGYGPPGGSYHPPPPGGSYQPPPPGGGFGPQGPMPPQQPKKDGPSAAVIALIALVVTGVFGLGGCLMCLYVSGKDTASTPVAGADPTSDGPPPSAGNDVWITSEQPFVKFLAPSGWDRSLKGDWGVFRAKDGQAVFAFTTFNQPGEATSRLSKAAWALGVSDIGWGSPTWGTVGRDSFKARMGEGSCNFNGPGGYIWYATVDSGTSDQMLLIYTVSGRGDRTHKDAALQSVRSLQKRP